MKIALLILGTLVLVVGILGLMNKERFYVASEFKGQIVSGGGQPVADVHVTRKITDPNGKETVHAATTDAEGRFTFPEIEFTGFFNRLAARYLPTTWTVGEVVEADFNGETKTLVEFVKQNLKKDGEVGSMVWNDQEKLVWQPYPIDFVCNIEKEPGADNNLPFWGVCEERVPGPLTKENLESKNNE